MNRSPVSRLSRVLAALALVVLPLPFAGGCSHDMEPKECLKLRVDAFDLLNKPQHCDTDANCRQSDWPGCAKPVSMDTYGKIGAIHDPFNKGKCEEPKADCKEAPVAYCKQGLCVHREVGTPEGAGNTPADKIIIQ
jgi:hypothetical protein